ncbi:MAG: AAA family ATPase [Streptosporangiaceae bacterium]|nr:AAA family ATPase [Streptosporangiaceae bacterium]
MLDIRVFGELRLAGAAAGLTSSAALPASRRARALLGWLIVHPGRQPRSRLAGLFWPDVLETSARASLRSAIWALRPALGQCLITTRDTVSLGGDLRVDLWEFRRLAGTGEPAAAVALADGELLQELDDDWVIDAREALDRDIAGALAELTERARAAGDPAAALGWARRRVALCPLDEAAGAALIQALADAGEEAGAAEALGRLRQRLGSELGVPVSEATEALIEPVPPMGSTGMIGRDRELTELTRSWRGALSDAGTTVVIEGEGGIGKSRLVRELADRAAGTAVVAGTAVGQSAPFAIWTEALGDLLTVTGPPEPMPGWAADLVQIVPALADRARPRPGGDPMLERVRLCEATVQFLGWAAARAPLLIALEDLHNADTASLDLVAYAGRRIGRLPVLLVLTRRDLPSRQHLDAVLGALRARGALGGEMRLGPLTGEAGRQLVATTAGGLPDEVVDRIVQLAGGNPLLAVEAARAAGSGELAELDLSGLDLRELDLGDTVRRAISRLSTPARLFAEFLAAAGRDLDRAETAALPLPNPARDAAEALGSGLLRTREGRTGFRHDLLREAVYDAIPDPVRARLHGEIARVLRKHGTRGRRGPRAVEIARHLRLAGQDEQAVSQLALAARDARAVAAMADAAGFLAEALAITPDDADLAVELAEVEAFRGLLAGSDRAFDHALECIAPRDSGALVSAWLRRGRWLRGGICHPRESHRSYRSALDVLDRDPDGDLPARAEALAGLAWAEAVAGDPEAVDGLLAEAERVLAGASPGDLLAHDIGVARGHALIRAGRFTESFGPQIAASAAAGRAGRPDMAYSCLSNAASAAACAGEFGRALDFADRALSLVTPNGLLRLCVYAQVARSAILRRLDQPAQAGQACDAAAGYAARIGLPELDGLVHTERGLLALSCSRPAAAAAGLAAGLELGAPVSRATTRLRLAEALALSGQPGPAEAELRNVVLEPVGPADFPATLVARMSRVQGLIAAARDDLPLAQRRLADSRAAWQRIVATLDSRQAGAGYVASLIDLGRPPVSSLIEPAAELATVTAELARLGDNTPSEGDNSAFVRPEHPQ